MTGGDRPRRRDQPASTITIGVLRALDSLPGPALVKTIATRASMSEQGTYACLRAARHRGLAALDGLLWALTNAGRAAIAPDLIVRCERVAGGAPVVPSERARCARCQAEVWVAPATREGMQRYQRPQIVCTGCVPAPSAGTTMVTSAGQRAEAGAVGLSPQAIADRFDLTLVDLDDPDAV